MALLSDLTAKVALSCWLPMMTRCRLTRRGTLFCATGVSFPITPMHQPSGRYKMKAGKISLQAMRSLRRYRLRTSLMMLAFWLGLRRSPSFRPG